MRNGKTWIRTWFLLFLCSVTSLIQPAYADDLTSNAIRNQIRAAYAQLSADYARKDVKGVFGFYTPAYTVSDGTKDGTANYGQVKEAILLLFGYVGSDGKAHRRPVSGSDTLRNTWSIQNLTVRAGLAIVIAKCSTDSSAFEDKGAWGTKSSVVVLVRDTWVKSGGKWRIASTRIIREISHHESS